jgi:hypothetical protein
MKPFIATILILLFAGVATAQPIVIPTLPPDGTYVLTVTGGAVTGFERANVLRIGGPPTDPDVPTPPPTDPTSLATLTTVSKAQYEKIPDGTGKTIGGLTVATVYRKIAADLRDGSINVAKASEQVGQIRDVLPKEWDTWKSETSKTWNQLQDKGLITSAATWAAGLDAIANGIAPAGAVAAYELDADEFLGNPIVGKLIEMLLSLLGETDSPIAKWLPLILMLLPIIFGGL